MFWSRILKRVLVTQIKALVMDAVQNHIHPRQVVSSRIHFLPEEASNLVDLFSNTQQQRARSTRRVVDTLQATLSGGNDLRENGADLLRCIEFTSLLTGSTRKLPDEVFIGVS